MIKLKIFSGRTDVIDGKYYFINVDDVVNKFLTTYDVEYIDCKYVIDPENGEYILLIYKEKGDK